MRQLELRYAICSHAEQEDLDHPGQKFYPGSPLTTIILRGSSQLTEGELVFCFLSSYISNGTVPPSCPKNCEAAQIVKLSNGDVRNKDDLCIRIDPASPLPPEKHI